MQVLSVNAHTIATELETVFRDRVVPNIVRYDEKLSGAYNNALGNAGMLGESVLYRYKNFSLDDLKAGFSKVTIDNIPEMNIDATKKAYFERFMNGFKTRAGFKAIAALVVGLGALTIFNKTNAASSDTPQA